MKIISVWYASAYFALISLVAAPTVAFPMTRSVPPESFLDYHVDTVPQLRFEVAYDPAVRTRLAHHFHLSGAALSAYVRDNLALQHLRKPLKTRVYCVRRDGREFFVVMTLKAGTPVFALRRTGKPILRLVCGNPLVAVLPPVPKKAVAGLAQVVKARVAGARLLQALPQAAAQAAVTAPAAALAPTIGLIETTGAGDVFVTAAGGAGASWLGWASLVGGTMALLPHGGGSGGIPTGGHQSTGVIRFTPPQNTPTGLPLPVPEPSPALALLLGGAGLVVLGLTRSQRQRRLD